MTKKTALDLLAERVRHLETLEEIMSNIHGWDGSAWHKLPMVWGYSDRFVEPASTAAVGAGDAEALTTLVPAGEIHIVQAVEIWHTDAAAQDIFGAAYDGATSMMLLPRQSTDAGVHRVWSGEVVLKAGDRVRAYAFAPGDGESVAVNIWGYKMKIAE